jgi:hypothetical protein
MSLFDSLPLPFPLRKRRNVFKYDRMLKMLHVTSFIEEDEKEEENKD